MTISGLQSAGMEEPPCLQSCSSCNGNCSTNNPSGASSVSCNLTRFYYDIEEWPVVEDVETIEAEEKEKELQQKEIAYTRIDL